MATAQLSPGVESFEQDFTGVVPSFSTTAAAIAGVFDWGPVNEPFRVSNELEFVNTFGKPNDANANYAFSAINFLAYGNNLLVNRADLTTARNASGATSAAKTGTIAVIQGEPDVVGTGTSFLTEIAIGDKITFTSTGTVYTGYVKAIASDLALTLESDAAVTASGLTFTSTKKVVVNGSSDYDAKTFTERSYAGQWAARYPGALGNSLKVSIADSASFAAWAYKGEFQSAPGTSSYAFAINSTSNDEVHIVVVDEDGLFTGVPGAVLERFGFVSKAADATSFGGGSNYYVNVVNRSSKYIWWMSHPTSGLGLTGLDFGSKVAAATAFKTITTALTVSLAGGDNGFSSDGEIIAAYDELENSELYNISMLIAGPANATVAGAIIDLAERRQDCVACVSPIDVASNGPIIGSTSTEIDKIKNYVSVTLNKNSSYAFMDSGWKYQYDKYNDVYRWVPLNGDIAGLMSRVDPWRSPAGLNRGQIRNVVKLAVNPNKTQRGELYSLGINPIVSLRGQGTFLMGDKTLLAKPSAFDRINVRRLFIYLRVTISTAAQYQLFELNTPSTRSNFRSFVEPRLRSVRAAEAIEDFRVICSEVNNPPDIVMRNEFVGDIKIKPTYSINYITLNFSAVRGDVSFSEAVG